MNLTLRFSFLALIGLTALQSCAPAKRTVDSHAKDCVDRLTKSEGLIAKNKFMAARDILGPMIDECTGSGVTEKAQYLLGEANYGLEDWISARSDFGIYLGQYPNSEYSNLASYRKAMASYNMPYKPGRDGSYTQNAIEDFNSFLYKFPNSAKVDSAKIYLEELHERLASDQHNVAKLYLKMGEPQAAVMTLKDFMEQHPNSAIVPDALQEMIQAYIRLDQYNQARLYVDSLVPYLDSTSTLPKKLNEQIDLAEKSFQANLDEQERLRKLRNRP